jgi:hypothetical protein
MLINPDGTPGEPIVCASCGRNAWSIMGRGLIKCGGRHGCRAVYSMRDHKAGRAMACMAHAGGHGRIQAFRIVAGTERTAAKSVCANCGHERPLTWVLGPFEHAPGTGSDTFYSLRMRRDLGG